MTSLMTLNQHKNRKLRHNHKINRIPGSCLLISSLPGLALRTLVESIGKPHDVNKRSQKPCLVNLIHVSNDTHLVFSVYHVTSRLGVI